MALHEEAGSDVESVGECDHPYDLLHSEHMYFFKHGLLNMLDFLLDTMEDVYNKNLYSMSWFYEGCYPFDTWEDNYNHWLYDQVFFAMRHGDHV